MVGSPSEGLASGAYNGSTSSPFALVAPLLGSPSGVFWQPQRSMAPVDVHIATFIEPNRHTEAPMHTNRNTVAQISNTMRVKTKVGHWSDAQMQVALASIEKGTKVITAAKKFAIPQNILVDHVHGRILKRKKGPPIVLSQSKESALEEYICKMQEYGYPFSMEHVCLKVAEMTKE